LPCKHPAGGTADRQVESDHGAHQPVVQVLRAKIARLALGGLHHQVGLHRPSLGAVVDAATLGADNQFVKRIVGME